MNGVRSMTFGDLDAVLSLERDVSPQPWARSHFEAFICERDGETHKQTLRTMPVSITWVRSGWVVYEEKELIGFICASELAEAVEVENLAVHQSFRRRGLGRRLLETVVLFAKKRGALSIRLEVRAENKAARSLYEGLGFRLTGIRPRYYADNREDAVLYDLPLTQG